MAVTIDAVGPSSAGAGASLDHLTWSHTCSGIDRLLIVGCALGKNPDSGFSIGSVTYAGVAMASLGLVHANNSTAGFIQMFYLVNPATGSNSVVIDSTVNTATLVGGSVSFNGVNQVTPVGTAQTAFGSGTAPSVAVTGTTAGNMVIDAACTGTAFTANGQTLRWQNNFNTGTAAGCAASQTAAAGGSVTMSYTVTSDFWGIIAVEVLAGATTSLPLMRPPGRIAPGSRWTPTFTPDSTPAVSNASPTAGNAAGTGQAFDAVINVQPAAGNASGTGQAFDATTQPQATDPPPLFAPAPGRISPTGAWRPFLAEAPTIVDARPAAGLASGTGQAFDATLNIQPVAGNAAGTGAAGSAAPNIQPVAGNATGTGTVGAPTPNVGPAAGNAAGTGSAGDPTLNIAPATGNAPATGQAFGTGTQPQATDPAPLYITPPGRISPRGSWFILRDDATTIVSGNPIAGLASGTGTAYNAALNIQPAAGNAAGTGTAGTPTPNVEPNAGNAAGTGAAYQSADTISGTVGVASGNGAAGAPTPNVEPNAGLASPGTGTAYPPTLILASNAVPGAATGTGAAGAPALNIAVNTAAAAGTGTAYQPGVQVPGAAPAQNAIGSGAAYTAIASVAVTAGLAAGTGTARGAALAMAVAPDTAAGTGTALGIIKYPIAAGAIGDTAERVIAGTATDLAGRDRAGTPTDTATRYRAGAPT